MRVSESSRSASAFVRASRPDCRMNPMWRKTLPKRLALAGTAAAAMSVAAAFVVETYSNRAFFRYDYVVVEYIVIPLLMVSVPAAFIGTVWWARQLQAAKSVRIALFLFSMCVLAYLGHPNIRGAGGLLLL